MNEANAHCSTIAGSGLIRTSSTIPQPLAPTVVRVRDFRRETNDIFTLTLDAPTEFRFQPGQFNMLYYFGVGEAAISLSGDADEKTALHTIRSVGSVTNALSRLSAGQSIGLRGPFGSAWPLETARGQDVVIVAGGIGLAPLRPVIYHIIRRRGAYGRVVLLYGTRTPQDLLYADEFDCWRQQGDVQVLPIVSKGEPSWRGAVGMVTALFSRLELDPTRTIGMMCGPEVMMRFVQREFQQRGISDDRLYLSLERNMQCAVGFCGHCQLGPEFLCMDGPVFRYDQIKLFFNLREA